MRILAKSIAFMFAVLAPSLAFAAGEQTIGDRLSAMLSDMWNPIFLLVAVGSTLLGFFVFFRGLLKLAQVGDGGQQQVPHIVPALGNIVGAAFLIALPDAAGMGMRSLLGAARGGGTLDGSGLDYNEGGMAMDGWLASVNGSLASVGSVENCLTSATPAACMAQNIATNIIPIAVYAIFAAVFIVGLVIFANQILELARSSEQSQSQRARGAATKIFSAILLMNAPVAFGLATKTMFGSDGTIGESGLTGAGSKLLTYTSGSSLEIVKKYSELIGHSFVILTFFGAWSFVRGVFMIKGIAEQRNQASLGMAMVYIVAGVLMANAKASTCMILNTVGGADMAAGFCS
jgi:hypothetical protein